MLPSVGRADDVNITASTNNGLVLDGFSGTTARIMPGVTVSNTTFNFSCPVPPAPRRTLAGLCASTQAWTVTNQGTIATGTTGDGVHFSAGGSVVNMGSISGGSNAIWIQGGAGGSVDNQAGATIQGRFGAIVLGTFANPMPGAVTNAGTITSDGQAVGLTGGTVTNLATGVIIGHGGANAVSLVNGASRTVNNSGLIQSNDSGLAAGVAIQNGTVVNNAGGRILGAYNGVWANGLGPTSITNAGLIEASRAAFASGAPGSAIEADGGGTIVNSGIIRSTSSNGTDVGILFRGPGSITNSGTIGSLDGGLAILFQGNGTHTLALDTGSVLNGNVQGGTGTDNLILDGTGTETISRFINFETLAMRGTDWTLTGAGSFATGVTVESGVLRVNGALTSPTISVLSGGTLGGVGTIAGTTTIASGGTIAPGNGIGTLNLAGNITFAPGSIYQVEANAAGQADKITATGAATIQGGTVRVLAGAGTYAPATTYTILTATGGRTGQFSEVTSNLAFLAPSLSYDPNNIYLTLTRNSIDFAAIGGTPNQRAAGSGVESLGWGNPIYGAVLQLDAPSARGAFDALSGEIHASAKAALIEDSRFVRDAAINRLRSAYAGVGASFMPVFAYAPGGPHLATPTTEHLAVWGQGYGSWGHTAGDGNAARLERSTGGFLLGADAPVFDSWRFGLLTGYSRTSFDVRDRRSSGSSDNYAVGAYGGSQWGSLALRSGVAYTWHDITTSRAAIFPGFSESLRSRYDAGTFQAFGDVGYRIGAPAASFEPFANLAYLRLNSGDFNEHGGAAALQAARQNTETTFTTLGLRTATEVRLGDTRLTARVSLGWRHAFGDSTPFTALRFADGNTFTIAGVPIAKDAAAADAGLDLNLTGDAKLGISYNGQFAPSGRDQAIKADFSLKF
jgi:outer membrane autotransporter protein